MSFVRNADGKSATGLFISSSPAHLALLIHHNTPSFLVIDTRDQKTAHHVTLTTFRSFSDFCYPLSCSRRSAAFPLLLDLKAMKGLQGPKMTAVPASLRPASLWLKKYSFSVSGPVIWTCRMPTTSLLSPQFGKSDHSVASPAQQLTEQMSSCGHPASAAVRSQSHSVLALFTTQ